MRASNGCSNLLGATVTAAAATYDVGTMFNFALTMTHLGSPNEDTCCSKEEGSLDDQATTQKSKSNKNKASWKLLMLKNKRWFKEQVINIHTPFNFSPKLYYQVKFG